MAAIVVDEVSKGCSTFSVAHKHSSDKVMNSSFFSSNFIGPISAIAFAIASFPPATSSVSGGIIFIMTKYNAIDIRIAQGAAAINQSSQVIVTLSVFSMKPIATMFCAAAVLMPTFQIDADCAVAIIRMPARRDFRSTPKARMMPIIIGTRQATRAVVLGTRNDSTMPTRIAPISTRLVRAPTRDNTNSAMRLSKPVMVIAAEMNSAAATSANAVLANPPSAMPRAALVPSTASGLAGLGAMPSRKAISATISTALTA